MKFLLPIIIVGGIFALLFLLERLFPLRPSTRSLFRRLVVNLAISALTFAVAISLVQPAAHWALQQHAEIQRVQKAGLADPSLLLYQLRLHDCDLPGGTSEGDEPELQPEAESFGKRWMRDARLLIGRSERFRCVHRRWRNA